MKIYTRGGDSGETSLFGGQRVDKDHLRIEAYGELDELNCLLGYCVAAAENSQLREPIVRESARLFSLGAYLATPLDSEAARGSLPVWPELASQELESEIDAWESELEPLRNFILPGGSELSARLHLSRAVCRRVERRVVALNRLTDGDAVSTDQLAYLNRLSDWLFVAARKANLDAGAPDQVWVPS